MVVNILHGQVEVELGYVRCKALMLQPSAAACHRNSVRLGAGGRFGPEVDWQKLYIFYPDRMYIHIDNKCVVVSFALSVSLVQDAKIRVFSSLGKRRLNSSWP